MQDITTDFPAQGKIPKHLYKPTLWVMNMAFINKLMLDANMLISVLAEKGGGKTTFAHMLAQSLDDSMQTCIVHAAPVFEMPSFLNALGTTLGCEGEITLATILAYCKEKKHHVGVIIDDAQYLSQSFLQALIAGLQHQGEEAYCHVCLLSDNSLAETLNELTQDSPYQDMVHTIVLRDLNELELKDYIKYCFPSQYDTIDDVMLAHIHSKTKGRMAAIHQYMSRLQSPQPIGTNVKPQQALPIQSVKKSWLSARVMMLSAIIVMLGFGILVQSRFQNSKEGINYTSLLANSHVGTDAPQSLKSSIPRFDVAATRKFLLPVHLRRADLLLMDEDDEVEAFHENMVVMDKVVYIPKVASSQKKDVIPGKTVKVTSSSKPKKHFDKHVKKKSTTLPHHGYTIQLLASQNLEELARFAKSQRIEKQTHIYRTQRQGKDWYVLTYGIFANHRLASAQKMKMSTVLNEFNPWVRSIEKLERIG